MNKKILAGVLLTSLLIGTNSFAANEKQKLDAIEKLGLKIDQSIDKTNLADEIKLQNKITLKFDKDGKLIGIDALSSTEKLLSGKSNAKFEDYLNSTISKLQKDGYIPKEYKLVDKQDILDNGYKVVFEKENSYNIKNPYNIITVSFDKKTNELKTFNRIGDFEVTKAPTVKLADAKKVAIEKLKSIKDFDETKIKSETSVINIDNLPTKFTKNKGLVVAYVFEYEGTKVYVDANTKELLGADKLKSNSNTQSTKPYVVSRIYGKDRIDTSIQIAKSYIKTSEFAILANQNNFPDSLSATVLSKKFNAPILLTDSKVADKSLIQEIKRLQTKYFVKIGGEKSISNEVAKQLLPEKSKVRSFKGADRYATNAEIIKEFKDADTCIIASGENFADSLSIGAYATKNGYPIVLVQKNKINDVTKQALKDSKIKKCYIVGGENSVSKSLEKELPQVIERIAGNDRYETSLKIADKFYKDAEGAYLASGEVFADSLAINPIAAKFDVPLILTPKDKLPQKTLEYLEKSKIIQVAIIGGEKTVSKQIQQELAKNNQEVATTVTFTYTKDGKKVTRELTNAEANELAKLMNEHDKYVKDQRLKSIFNNYFTLVGANGRTKVAVSVNIEKDEVEIDDAITEKGAILNKDNGLAKQYIKFIENLKQN
ncbi:MAG: cell wall-binding repeat-containing protein [Finegoldia magna]|uniref:cell wall-binding repeat-containing protein n=1 Tax=Finegoldia magna TaxID=1260 RepID=UPI000764034E|nr:cell wall-binding repeat-containing protein [Finegoldia magna]KXA07635.1 putative cell wall binding repeat 2 [Finegoldia magna]MDU5743507.1 cell wall-binding repeat-containing protein [Finegoldia magna]MDU5923845.1 cell wall-binding repeat-containing protein [Finegoldia magna]